MLRRQMFSLVS